MNSIHYLVARDDKEEGGLNHTMISLLISLLVLFIAGAALVAALFFLRNARRARQQAHSQQLPLYEKRRSTHRRLTIQASPYGNGRDSVVVYEEKKDYSPSTPTSPVPEIRITFPDEVDESGKQQAGRVLVVRVGDHSVGLEPMEDLPAYQRDASDRFDSLDLDRIGGLKEKDDKYYS